MVAESSISLWDTSAAEPSVAPSGLDETRCDVAIVGGGFTGLSTALHGAEKGLNCHVLEARTIGHGGSGRNVGLVNAGLWLPPHDVEGLLGEARGAALVRELGDMPDYVFSLIEKHGIDCEAMRTGTIHAAHAPKGFADLQERAEGWARLGAPVDLLGPIETAEKLGTRRFHGGLLDHRAGAINPMGYARGLARAARAAGATISCGVTVQGLRRENGRWLVETDAGTLIADKVVLGTNAYTDGLWPGLKNTFTMIHFFQVATRPLGARVTGILEDVRGIWDTAPVMFSLRRDADGRLIVGSMGALMGGVSRRWAARTLRRLFPDLGPVEFETAWHGQIAMTPDHLFRIHKLADGVYAPIGYNGRGITTGTMFGRALANLFTGADAHSLPVPVSPLASATGNFAKTGFYHTAFALNQLAKSL